MKQMSQNQRWKMIQPDTILTTRQVHKSFLLGKESIELMYQDLCLKKYQQNRNQLLPTNPRDSTSQLGRASTLMKKLCPATNKYLQDIRLTR